MSKRRFTDIGKWDDPWFMDLPTELKLLWLYILDNCDHAGIWKINTKLAEFKLGVTPPWGNGIGRVPESFVGRVEISPRFSDYWFIPKFLRFQYPSGLHVKSPPAKGAIKIIDSLGFNKRVTELFGKGFITLKEREKEKDKEKDKSFVVKEDKEKTNKSRPLNAQEVTAYAVSIGFDSLDGEYFINSNEAKGWLVGKNRTPVKDWRAVVRTWKSNFKNNVASQPKGVPHWSEIPTTASKK